MNLKEAKTNKKQSHSDQEFMNSSLYSEYEACELGLQLN